MPAKRAISDYEKMMNCKVIIFLGSKGHFLGSNSTPFSNKHAYKYDSTGGKIRKPCEFLTKNSKHPNLLKDQKERKKPTQPQPPKLHPKWQYGQGLQSPGGSPLLGGEVPPSGRFHNQNTVTVFFLSIQWLQINLNSTKIQYQRCGLKCCCFSHRRWSSQ